MKSQRRVARHAFTMIELLTVIAIIAILAAIIFPVFAAVRENARRTSCMSNMHQISTALKQYELDNRRYPDFLFAPALRSNGANGCALTATGKPVVATGSDVACTPEQAAATGKLGGDFVDEDGNVVASGGLYPEYVKSLNTYLCPNNSWYLPTGDTQFNKAPSDADYPVTNPIAYFDAQTIDKANPDTLSDVYGSNGKAALRFYKFDSYDSNPAVRKNGAGAAVPKIEAATNVWTTRYQRQWMPAAQDPNPDRNLNQYPNQNDRQKQLYQNQLMWRNPSDDSVVTMCTFHAEKNKVIVLTLGGTAKVLDIARLKEQAGAVEYNASADFETYKMTPQ